MIFFIFRLFAFGQRYGVPSQVIQDSPKYQDLASLSLKDHNRVIEAELTGYCAKTLKSYECCKPFLTHCPEFPINLVTLKLFLLNEAEQGRSYISLERIISALNFVCDILDYPRVNTTKLKKIKRCLRKIAKPKRLIRNGFQRHHLHKLWKNVCKYGLELLTLTELCTFVMINFLYYTGTRFSCIQNLQLCDIIYSNEFLHCTINKSKTDQSGNGHIVYIPYVPKYNPLKLLCLYLNIICENRYLFSASKYDKSQRTWFFDPLKSISYSTAYRQFKLFLNKFGVPSTNFGLHSPRIGFTTDLFESNVPSDVIDRAGRWMSKTTKFGYCQHEETYYKQHLKRFVYS